MKGQIEPLNKLIGEFMKLPGVGSKTAQRYALRILKLPEAEVKEFADTLTETRRNVHYCSVCGNFTQQDPCPICRTRDRKQVCVVKEAKDVLAMEKIRDYAGTYHVLGGTINPMEGIGPNDIRIKELVQRVSQDGVTEVIVATNPDVEGEVTATYLAKLLKPLGVRVTRLAQGVSIGSDLEYADEVTLSRAMEDRKDL